MLRDVTQKYKDVQHHISRILLRGAQRREYIERREEREREVEREKRKVQRWMEQEYQVCDKVGRQWNVDDLPQAKKLNLREKNLENPVEEVKTGGKKKANVHGQ